MGVTTLVTNEVHNITGQFRATKEAGGRTPRMLKSGDLDDALYEEMWETITAGDVWRGELTNRRQDGDRYVAEQTDEELTSELDRIGSSADHVVELTTAAADIAKTISSGESADLEPMSLTRILVQEAEKRQETFDDATIELPESPPQVPIAANELLSSVFRNLINNAVKHNDADDPVVSVTMRETDGRVRVQVADNGPGVPDTLKDEVFGDEVKGLGSSGTGMGLYLVTTLVEMYGGEVWVEDNDPTGAVFSVEFDTIDGSMTGSGE